jgi:hypothetical protein
MRPFRFRSVPAGCELSGVKANPKAPRSHVLQEQIPICDLTAHPAECGALSRA